MLNLILFGAPGAGKGTQSERLVSKYGFNQISTGEIIRKQISEGTELGKSMQDYIARGEFAPDELVIGIIQDFLKNCPSGAGNIFDGFPRNLVQAEEFDAMLKANNMKPAVLLSIDVTDELLVERILNRGKSSGRADDASIDVINNRLSIYKSFTEPVVSYYNAKNKYVACDGVGDFDEVFDRLCTQIDALID